MNRNTLIKAAASIFLVAIAGSALAQSDPAVPQVSYSSLPNGVRVIVEPRHTVAIVAIDVWVQAGTRMEKPGEEGAAHYIEHVVFKGTPTHPHDGDIDGAIEDLGGSLDAATSYDWAHFYTTVPSESMKDALAVVGDAVQHASITSAQVESERPIILSEIQRTSDDPDAYAGEQVRQQLYGKGYAYGRPVTGTSDQVQNITQSTIAAFYHRCYVPQATAVVVVGDTTVADADAAVASVFGSWSGPAAPPPPPAPSVAPIVPFNQTLHKDADDATLVMGWHAPSVSDKPDAWVMDVLLTYLGQGATDLLDTDLHLKQKLVSNIGADFLTQHDPGLMTVTATLSPDNVTLANAAILNDIASIQNTPLTDRQLASAKQQLLSSYLFDTETVSGTADSLGFYEMIDSYEYDTDYLDHISAVTAAQVQDLARRDLSTTNYAEIVVAPTVIPESSSISLKSNGPSVGIDQAAAKNASLVTASERARG